MIVGDKIGEGAADIDGNGLGIVECPVIRGRIKHGCSPAINSPGMRDARTVAASRWIVSTVAQVFIAPCRRKVSKVDPLRQRTHPSRRPPRNICRIPYQSYWMCRIDQSAEITTMAGRAERGERAQPR